MNKILAIAKKELGAYFYSPLAYIVLFITTGVFNIFFFMIIDQNREAHLKDVFLLMEFLFVFVIPILTMKVFAEERQQGTMEFLMTHPISKLQIVAGKFLGSAGFFTVMMVPTILYWFIFDRYSDFDKMTALSGYFGIWLEGIFFVAIGIMMSAFTRNQIIAALSSYVFLFFLYFSQIFTVNFHGVVKDVFNYMAVMNHSSSLFTGMIQTSDLMYFVSGIIFCLFITRIIISQKV